MLSSNSANEHTVDISIYLLKSAGHHGLERMTSLSCLKAKKG